MNKNTVDAFYYAICQNGLRGNCNSNFTDFLLYPDIPDSIAGKVLSNFQISFDETLLLVRDTSFWNDGNQGLVLTDAAIYIITDNENIADTYARISLADIGHVEYMSAGIYLFGNSGDRNDCIPVHITYFGKDLLEANYAYYGNIICNVLNETAATQEGINVDAECDKAQNTFGELMERGQVGEAIKYGMNFRDEFQNATLTPDIAWAMNQMGDTKKALAIIDEDFAAMSEEQTPWKSYLMYAKADILKQNGDAKGTREASLYTYLYAPKDFMLEENTSLKDAAGQYFGMANDYYVSHFVDLPYNERKLLVPVDRYSDLGQKSLAVITMDSLTGLQFPVGHPVANQLYVAHPYIQGKYLPFENYELELIEDKVREYCQIMQCLGATEIDIECLNSSYADGEKSASADYAAGVDLGFENLSGAMKKGTEDKFIKEISQSINLHQRFNPTHLPQLPEKLIWYWNEPSWQRLYEQRMHGGFLEHEERIETRKNKVVEGSELQNAKAELEWLWIEAYGNKDSFREEKYAEKENAVISIRVKFAPLEALEGAAYGEPPEDIEVESIPVNTGVANGFTQEELEYLEEYQYCLEGDSIISPRERHLLDKLRTTLGISDSRAKEIEALATADALEDNEREYLQEYAACLEEEGVLSSRTLRLLDRLRNSLKISEERARIIEKLAAR